MGAENQPISFIRSTLWSTKSVHRVIDARGDRICDNLGGNAENFVPDV